MAAPTHPRKIFWLFQRRSSEVAADCLATRTAEESTLTDDGNERPRRIGTCPMATE